VTAIASRFELPLDPTNPGHYYACCGLLELAHRLWPGSEGCFDAKGTAFRLLTPGDPVNVLSELLSAVTEAGIQSELTADEHLEFESLKARRKALDSAWTAQDEERQTHLDKLRREGAVILPQPFDLTISWWQEEGGDIPKTFAGQQEVLRIVRSMASELLKAGAEAHPLDYRCLLFWEGKRVEPFYFDAQRFAHPLDVGFSLDVQEKRLRALAAPLTEFLALVGLQRFRPRQTEADKWAFEYFLWPTFLGPTVAAAVASGAVSARGVAGYRFPLRFRDEQKRYKAFGQARPLGGHA
jgi:CRISPR-associated protein Csb3